MEVMHVYMYREMVPLGKVLTCHTSKKTWVQILISHTNKQQQQEKTTRNEILGVVVHVCNPISSGGEGKDEWIPGSPSLALLVKMRIQRVDEKSCLKI